MARPRRQTEENIALVGFGNWGTALACALTEAGTPPQTIFVRQLHGEDLRRARKLGVPLVKMGPSGHPRGPLAAEVLWICTPDSAIAATARAFAQARWTHARPIVLHSSGALSSAELDSLRDACHASVASVHPLMSFPLRAASPLRGVPFALEGDPRAVRMATRIVHRLGGDPFQIRARDKTLYHAFGAFASPLVTTLLTAALAVGRAAGIPPATAMRRMRPMVERTMKNFFEQGPVRSLSGPVARGDAATVAGHMNALRAHPGPLEIYRALQRYSVETLPRSNKTALRKVLAGP
jgi:predicted short-subunit dehydrogenase-like oxidoreductase (DUF2520 family)